MSSIPIPRLRRRLKQHLPDDSLASVQLELDYGRSSSIEGEAAAVNESRYAELQDFSKDITNNSWDLNLCLRLS